MLSLDDFHRVSVDDKEVFQQHYAQYPPTHSGSLFSTIVSWNNYAHYHFCTVNNHLLLMHRIKNETQFRLPSGPFDKNLVKQVLSLARKEESFHPVVFIERQQKETLLREFPGLQMVEDRDSFDYVYRAADLAQLAGTPYAKIRNRLNQFQKKYHYTVEPLSAQNMDEAQAFLTRWCLWRDCESDELLENERKAILFAMAHFSLLGLSGLALRLNNQIEALAVFEQMNPDTAVVHFEKGSPDYDGIYKAINMETAKYLQQIVPFIDREEDMGLPGLRQAKMSYHPHHMVEVSLLEKNSIPR